MLDLAKQIRADFSVLDRRAVFAFVYAAAGLTCISFFKKPEYLDAVLSHTSLSGIGEQAVNPVNNNLYGLVWWVFVSITFYFIVPALIVKLVQKRNLREIGLS